jgi:hypothetical protein
VEATKTITPREFGQELRRFLREHRIGVGQAADHIGFSARQVNGYFNGKRRIERASVLSIEELASVTDAPLTRFHDLVDWSQLGRESVRISHRRSARPVARAADDYRDATPRPAHTTTGENLPPSSEPAAAEDATADTSGRWTRWLVAVVASLALLAATVVVAVHAFGSSASLPAGAHGKVWRAPTHAGSGVALTVDSRSAIGAKVRADVGHPLQLVTEPYSASCPSCLIPGTVRHTGETYQHALCQTTSDYATNGNLSLSGTRRNPGYAQSTRWYGIRQPNGTLGFVNAVWIAPRSRIALRVCPAP